MRYKFGFFFFCISTTGIENDGDEKECKDKQTNETHLSSDYAF